MCRIAGDFGHLVISGSLVTNSFAAARMIVREVNVRFSEQLLRS